MTDIAPLFAVAVDLVILTVRPPRVEVLLIERAHEPFPGHPALPGGFVGQDEALSEAARRKLVEETGVGVEQAHLEQLASFGAVDRDPRMRVMSVAYLAMTADPPGVQAGIDAEVDAGVDAEVEALRAEWVVVDEVDRDALAFDHRRILEAGLERARAKLEYSTLATNFCGSEFTIGELRSVYEAVWGVRLDPPNFHRKVLATDGFVEPTGDTVAQAKGRPAKTYRAGPATVMVPPLQR